MRCVYIPMPNDVGVYVCGGIVFINSNLADIQTELAGLLDDEQQKSIREEPLVISR